MKPDRILEMEKYIQSNEPVKLTELCDHFNISMSTLRRDLSVLSKKNSINKMYGCVSRMEEKSENKLMHSRSTLYAHEKQKIAKIAASLINDNDVIFIDSGSTVSLIVEYLDVEKKITIVTNNLDVIIRGRELSNIDIYILPGKLNRANNSFSNLTDENLYYSYNISKAFMSCSGIDLVYGISHTDISERVIKQCIIKKTPMKFLLVDNTKFGKAAPLHVCQINEFSTICTNVAPEQPYIDYCNKNGIQLLYEDS
ncbi:MAG: DeoR/GlpR family DNA-binding transcription regulator [Flexilinea sp.]